MWISFLRDQFVFWSKSAKNWLLYALVVVFAMLDDFLNSKRQGNVWIMERFKTIDDSIVTQKENNPSLAKDEKDRNARDGSTALNYVPQLVGGRYQTETYLELS